MIKKTFIIIIFLLSSAVFWSKITKASSCDTPLAYKVGTIDRRFGISQDQLLQNLREASNVWSSKYGKNLFVYDDKATLMINLVYDERQSLNSKIIDIKDQVNQSETTLKPKIVQYQKLSADFQERLSKYNAEVNYWNSRGGAPQGDYERLTQEGKSLKEEAGKLNSMAHELNASADFVNIKINQLNRTVNTFNNVLSDKPEEGLYDPLSGKIDIFFNVNQNEFVHTLAHEMGHAIGMTHVENPKSIMYSKSNSFIELSGEDLNELKFICRERPLLDIYSQKASVSFEKMLKKFNLSQSF